jgi:hypothetical protein
VATEQGGEALAKTVVRDAEQLGGIGGKGGKAGELAGDIKKVEAAAEVSKETLKKASTAATATGDVHITESGGLFSCLAPLPGSARPLGGRADQEPAAPRRARAPGEGGEGRRGPVRLTGRARQALRHARQPARGRGPRIGRTRHRGWLPTLAERFPILKDIVLGKPP